MRLVNMEKEQKYECSLVKKLAKIIEFLPNLES